VLYAAWTAVNMQGCYRDDPRSRDLPVQMRGFERTLTPAACIAACRNASYIYAAVQVYSPLSTDSLVMTNLHPLLPDQR